MNSNHATNALFCILLLCVCPLESSLQAQETEKLSHYQQFIRHVKDDYFTPALLQAETLEEAVKKAGPRFVAVTMGYALERQLDAINNDEGRRAIFKSIIAEAEAELKQLSAAYARQRYGSDLEQASVEKFVGNTLKMFAFGLLGANRRDIEEHLGAPSRIEPLFEDAALAAVYPDWPPPIEYIFGTWQDSRIADGTVRPSSGRLVTFTGRTGKYGYIFEVKDESTLYKDSIRYWRVEGDTMYWFYLDGVLFGEFTFSVDGDQWVFQGPLYDRDGTQLVYSQTGEKLGKHLSTPISDDFLIKSRGAGQGLQTPAAPPAGMTPPAGTGSQPKPGQPAKAVAEKDAEKQEPEKIDLAHDAMAVKKALNNALKMALGSRGSMYQFRSLLSADMQPQMDRADAWISKNKTKFGLIKSSLQWATISFGDPQFNAAGNEATSSVSIRFEHLPMKLPVSIESIKLKLEEESWKISGVVRKEKDEDGN